MRLSVKEEGVIVPAFTGLYFPVNKTEAVKLVQLKAFEPKAGGLEAIQAGDVEALRELCDVSSCSVQCEIIQFLYEQPGSGNYKEEVLGATRASSDDKTFIHHSELFYAGFLDCYNHYNNGSVFDDVEVFFLGCDNGFGHRARKAFRTLARNEHLPGVFGPVLVTCSEWMELGGSDYQRFGHVPESITAETVIMTRLVEDMVKNIKARYEAADIFNEEYVQPTVQLQFRLI